jgi:hypothetical protein
MAKSQRSTRKKALQTQRRQTLKSTWQDEAEKRRYAALAASAASAPVAAHVNPPSDDEGTERKGREGKVAKPKRDSAMMEVEEGGSGKKGKKGFKVKGGVVKTKKTHNGKKSSALWVSNFHKSKKGKKGLV